MTTTYPYVWHCPGWRKDRPCAKIVGTYRTIPDGVIKCPYCDSWSRWDGTSAAPTATEAPEALSLPRRGLVFGNGYRAA